MTKYLEINYIAKTICFTKTQLCLPIISAAQIQFLSTQKMDFFFSWRKINKHNHPENCGRTHHTYQKHMQIVQADPKAYSPSSLADICSHYTEVNTASKLPDK